MNWEKVADSLDKQAANYRGSALAHEKLAGGDRTANRFRTVADVADLLAAAIRAGLV